MARNNDVFQVLVTKGNKLVLDEGKKPTELLPGQVGVFNAHTGLSVKNSTLGVRDIFLAVGVDNDGDGITDDVVRSSGNLIQLNEIKYYSFRPHTASRPMIFKLKNYTADCETEYGIKFEIRNQEIYRTQGYNGFYETYTIKTSPCTGCESTCPSGDSNEITKGLYNTIIADSKNFLKPRIVFRYNPGPVTGVVADVNGYLTPNQVDTLIAYNKTISDSTKWATTDLIVETVPLAIRNWFTINLKYFFPRQTVAVVTKIAGLEGGNGEIETIQTAVFEEGSGYDVKQLEYEAAGQKQGKYRLSELNGVAEEKNFYANVNTKYDIFALAYDQASKGAWLTYLHNLATLIAVPEEDSITRTDLASTLDRYIQPFGFDLLGDDTTYANSVPNIVEQTTSSPYGINTDGIA